LKEEIFIEQLEGFVVQESENKVFLLWFEESHSAWNGKIDDNLFKLGFLRSSSEWTLNVKTNSVDHIAISFYIDDLLVTGSNTKLV